MNEKLINLALVFANATLFAGYIALGEPTKKIEMPHTVQSDAYSVMDLSGKCNSGLPPVQTDAYSVSCDV